MDSDIKYEEKVRSVTKNDVVVLRDVSRFPVYGVDFVSEDMIICLNHAGSGRALYDMHEMTFKPNEISIIMPNHTLKPLESSPDYRVTLIVVSNSFVNELKMHLLTHDYNKFHLMPTHVLTNVQMSWAMRLVDLLQLISESPFSKLPNRKQMLLQQLSIAYELLNVARKNTDINVAREDRKNALFNDFCNLLARHYRAEHEVKFYAEKLHLTTKYFSSVIQKTIGMSASDWIDQYLSTQAKQMIATRPDMTIQEVTFALGFTEQAAFCRFFKRVTGLTPTQYRKSTNA